MFARDLFFPDPWGYWFLPWWLPWWCLWQGWDPSMRKPMRMAQGLKELLERLYSPVFVHKWFPVYSNTLIYNWLQWLQCNPQQTWGFNMNRLYRALTGLIDSDRCWIFGLRRWDWPKNLVGLMGDWKLDMFNPFVWFLHQFAFMKQSETRYIWILGASFWNLVAAEPGW